jgi:hypothetical protein
MQAISDRINIDSRQVLLNIGYCNDCKPSARIAPLVNEYIEHAGNLIEPSYSGVIRDIKSVKGSRIVIEGSVIFQSKVIAQLMEQCEKVAVFLLTIGNHLEETVRQMAEDGLILQATVLDAIGSVAAEAVADFVHRRVGEVARAQGLCTSLRFSPGYCDWGLCQQKMVFEAVGGDSAGIHLTEDCLMLPSKSVSGIIGIGPCNSVENYNPCKTCPKYDCPSRREV